MKEAYSIQRNSVKGAFGNTLFELQKNKRLEEIMVKDIIETSGFSNRTFYNYFHDKNDLISYVFFMDLNELIESQLLNGEIQSNSGVEVISDDRYQLKAYVRCFEAEQLPAVNYWQGVGNFIYNKRHFYKEAFACTDQNCLQDSLFQFYTKMLKEELLIMLKGRKISQLDLDFIAGYFANSQIGNMIRWTQHGINRFYPGKLNYNYSEFARKCMILMLEDFIK